MTVARQIFIGDIHGCFAEVVELLERISVTPADHVVALGDMTRKGPAVDRCIDLWLERGYQSVLGNNDDKQLRRAASWKPWWLAPSPERRILRSARHLGAIRSWPLFLDFPDRGVVAVHGGILPNSDRFDAPLAPRDAALALRHIRRNARGEWAPVPKGKQQNGDAFWADIWSGDRIVVYGHTPRAEVRIHPRAIGLDTGCVYGGLLSAAVFSGRDSYEIVSVRARRAYAR